MSHIYFKLSTFLDVVVRECPSILELFPGKDESLLVGRDTLFVLNLGLHVLYRVRGLHLEGNSLTRQRFHEDLHLPAPHTL